MDIVTPKNIKANLVDFKLIDRLTCIYDIYELSKIIFIVNISRKKIFKRMVKSRKKKLIYSYILSIGLIKLLVI
jgi:hypothetical protein